MNYRIKAHESFILREGWLNKGIAAVKENPKVFFENAGADALGVGTNMAKAIRYWLRASGLTQERGKAGTVLTPLGEIFFQEDPYFEDLFALWLIHINIARSSAQATLWFLFFNRFELSEFNKEEMEYLLREAFLSLTGISHAGSGISADCDALLQMYTRKASKDYDPEEKKVSPFAALGLVKRRAGRFAKEQPDLSLLHELAVYYCLQDCMEQGDGYCSAAIDDLLTLDGAPGKLLNLKRSALCGYLDGLSRKGLLSVNHTAGLDMVYQRKKEQPESVVKQYYEQKRKGCPCTHYKN